jgi:predicted flap endonuclease-1-like 5' DNA nuclease
MIDVISMNTVAIIVALLVGIAIGWWMFSRVQVRRSVAEPELEAPATPAPVAPPPVEAAPPPEPEPALAVPAAGGPPDNLQMLKGVGPKLAQKLNEQGILRYEQLAALDATQVDALDARMEQFQGRIAKDRLVEQAAYLARGDLDGFQKTFGNLGSGGEG